MSAPRRCQCGLQGAHLVRCLEPKDAERMVSPQRAPLVAALFALTFALAGCGLGRDQTGDNGTVRNPIVAATVNGRPIYVEDVRAHAVARGLLQEGQDLDANSDAFYFALEELIQV